MQEYTSPSERLKALTDQLEQGVSDIFQSGQYAAYLTAMSKFHHYSFGNTMLIFMQCPNATNVAGYHDWRRNFGRQVKRGERGITISFTFPILSENCFSFIGQHPRFLNSFATFSVC